MESITSNDNITTTSNISNITITTPWWWKPSPPTSLSRHGAVDKLVQHLFWLWSTGLGSQVQGEGQENIEGSENKTTWQKLLMIRALKSFYNIITSNVITIRRTKIITIDKSYSEVHAITRRSTTYDIITRRSTTYTTSSPGEAGGEGFLKKLFAAQ